MGSWGEPVRYRFRSRTGARTGHAGTLETIFTNLISNALKFVRAGVPPQVRIWAEDRGALVRVWVEDNGMREVLLRHCPSLGRTLADVRNSFFPW